jgi:hypothetical protein
MAGWGSGHAEAPRVAVLRQIDGSAECVGDCDGCRSVSIDELVRLVHIALGTTPLSACPGSRFAGPITISELIQAVNSALLGCTAR